jgi:iron complex outermembrane recepter protein
MTGKFKPLLFLMMLLPLLGMAQQYQISGSVTNALTGEPLPFANILYGEGKGVVADPGGNFSFSLPKGTYSITVSFVGTEKVTREVILDRNMQLDFALKSTVLQEFEVVADFARTRETPVAFSTIPVSRIQEELASQDIPMILNKTPGVYATQQGGGDGDARINIRGFNQRNIAVMIDGIPVNDMENGWVYWSNWFGLDMATRSIQVQRGLGASKLAIPSVGGTMNIITSGIETRKNASVKYEVGSDMFRRVSFGLNSGKLKNGWGITAAGSFKEGNGEVEMTWTRGYFYFFRVDKKVGKHLISLTGMGAPQSHGQRAYTMPLSKLDTAYAHALGIGPNEYSPGPINLGLDHNPHWGWLRRDSTARMDVYQRVNERKNYYHKPQFSLRDFWTINSNLSVSNILYLSVGNGGGTGLTATPPPILSGSQAGLINFQQIYDNNVKQNGTPTAGKGIIMRSAVNNHYWTGLLSTVDYKVSEKLKLSGGIDGRYYVGQHYQIAYDLLGAEFWIDEIKSSELRNKTNPSNKRIEGDKISYNNDGIVWWGGLFGQAEYKLDKWNFFLNLTTANSGYQRKDYFLKQDIVIGDEVFEQAVGYIRKFDIQQAGFISVPDTFFYQDQAYTINSPEARTATTPVKWIPGYTAKAGANFNLSPSSNIFANIGYLNKAPRFNNVYDRYNRLYRLIENERVKAVELGYSYFNRLITINFNTYYTLWENKPADYTPTVMIDDVTYNVNINGVDAIHKGVELELGIHLMPGLISETVVSLGDWKWNSQDSARIVDQNTGDVLTTRLFDARGLYVGDAAQHQFRQSFRYEWRKKMYLSSGITYFGKHYANFDPLDMDPVNNKWAFDSLGMPKQSWKIPDYYIIDLNTGYNFNFKGMRFDLRMSILNLLDARYISDASNNDSYTGQTFNSFDARSAAVFIGAGRRYNVSLRVTL